MSGDQEETFKRHVDEFRRLLLADGIDTLGLLVAVGVRKVDGDKLWCVSHTVIEPASEFLRYIDRKAVVTLKNVGASLLALPL